MNVAKTRPIRKLELNTCGNFMNLRSENYFVTYLVVKYIQIKSTIENIYNIIYTMPLNMPLYSGSSEV